VVEEAGPVDAEDDAQALREAGEVQGCMGPRHEDQPCILNLWGHADVASILWRMAPMGLPAFQARPHCIRLLMVSTIQKNGQQLFTECPRVPHTQAMQESLMMNVVKVSLIAKVSLDALVWRSGSHIPLSIQA